MTTESVVDCFRSLIRYVRMKRIRVGHKKRADEENDSNKGRKT